MCVSMFLIIINLFFFYHSVSGLTGYTYYYYAFLSAFFTFAIQLNKRMSENQVR